MKKLIIELRLLCCGYTDYYLSFPYRYGGGMSSAKAALESDTRVWSCTVVCLNNLFSCTSLFSLHFFPHINVGACF